MSDESKLAPLSGPGVSGNEPLAGREERQVIAAEFAQNEAGPIHVLTVKLHESGVEQVRAIVREEILAVARTEIKALMHEQISAALKETFQR